MINHGKLSPMGPASGHLHGSQGHLSLPLLPWALRCFQGRKIQPAPHPPRWAWLIPGSPTFIPSRLGHQEGEFFIIPNAAHFKELCSRLSRLPPMPPTPVFLQPRGFLRASGTWLEPVVPLPVPMNTHSPCSPGPCPSQHRLDPCLACLNRASNLVLPWAPSPISLPVEKTSCAEALSKNKTKQKTQLRNQSWPGIFLPLRHLRNGQPCWVLFPSFSYSPCNFCLCASRRRRVWLNAVIVRVTEAP